MVSPDERDALREELLIAARADARIDAAAVVGSAAVHREDRWSDIDLAFRVVDGLTPEHVAGDWTAQMYGAHDAVEHLDIWVGHTLYRVFLLASSLQVDLSFWPAAVFAASGPAFRLVFGQANEPTESMTPQWETLIGMGWLYALHARSSIARGRCLQALYMVNGIRDQVVSLACLRFGLPSTQGRGVDDLPGSVRATIADTVVHGLESSELSRSFAAVVDVLLREVECIDPSQAARLAGPMAELVRTAQPCPNCYNRNE